MVSKNIRGLLVRGDHKPTFNGLHNASKAKVNMVLKQDTSLWLSSKEIHNLTGVPHASLAACLTKWFFWEHPLVIRKKVNRPGLTPFYIYQLSERGKHWDSNIPADKYFQYQAEMMVYRKAHLVEQEQAKEALIKTATLDWGGKQPDLDKLIRAVKGI